MIGTLLTAVFWAIGLMDVKATLLEMVLKREAMDSMLNNLCWMKKKTKEKKENNLCSLMRAG